MPRGACSTDVVMPSTMDEPPSRLKRARECPSIAEPVPSCLIGDVVGETPGVRTATGGDVPDRRLDRRRRHRPGCRAHRAPRGPIHHPDRHRGRTNGAAVLRGAWCGTATCGWTTAHHRQDGSMSSTLPATWCNTSHGAPQRTPGEPSPSRTDHSSSTGLRQRPAYRR